MEDNCQHSFHGFDHMKHRSRLIVTAEIEATANTGLEKSADLPYQWSPAEAGAGTGADADAAAGNAVAVAVVDSSCCNRVHNGMIGDVDHVHTADGSWMVVNSHFCRNWFDPGAVTSDLHQRTNRYRKSLVSFHSRIQSLGAADADSWTCSCFDGSSGGGPQNRAAGHQAGQRNACQVEEKTWMKLGGREDRNVQLPKGTLGRSPAVGGERPIAAARLILVRSCFWLCFFLFGVSARLPCLEEAPVGALEEWSPKVGRGSLQRTAHRKKDKERWEVSAVASDHHRLLG